MTTTPDYIKKCEMAEEIQAMRAPEITGTPYTDAVDFSFDSGDFFVFTEERSNRDSVFVYGDTVYQPEISVDDKKEIFINMVSGTDAGGGYCAKKIIWLPRLDQLLDLLSGVEISPREVTGIFSSDREEKLLTVLMRNKFGKKWDGEQWIQK